MRMSDIVGHAGLSGYAITGMILFMVVFIAIVIRVFWPSRAREFEEARRLPLEDDAAGGAPRGENR